MRSFGEKLQAVSLERGRLCVGIDPHPALLEQWGLGVTADGLRRFSRICVEAFGPSVALVKPQVAFYEAFGSQGYAVLEETIRDLREQGALVVADAKRGDIGSTMAAYAEAWLGDSSPLCADAVTVSPYLGFEALRPALELAHTHGRGVFVLDATSNPEGRQVQDCVNTDGVRLDQLMVDAAAAENSSWRKAGEFGDVGVVVGATLDSVPDLTDLNGPVLMPGVGAQGASAADVDTLAEKMSAWVFPNISRGILRHGPGVFELSQAVSAAAADYPGFPR